VQWLQAVVDRLLPVIRRDCNYVNLERIRAQSTWDENNQMWHLPKLTIEKTQLPPARPYCQQHAIHCNNCSETSCLYSLVVVVVVVVVVVIIIIIIIYTFLSRHKVVTSEAAH